jgi:hypothetical protein
MSDVSIYYFLIKQAQKKSSIVEGNVLSVKASQSNCNSKINFSSKKDQKLVLKNSEMQLNYVRINA